jgi:predicted chitinase
MINSGKFVFGSGPQNEANMDSSEVLTTLILCGFMGALGQGVRAAVGLKSAATLAAQNPSQHTEFDVAYFTLSLMIGFTAGILAGLAIGLNKLAKIDPNDPKLLLAIVAAGYAGTDFIENAFTNLVPRSVTPPQFRVGDEASHPADRAPSKGNLKSLPLSSRAGKAPSYVQMIDNADLSAALKVVAPRVNTNIWVPALSPSFLKFDLTTDRRVAAAVGQFLVEAGDSFQELAEDLDYTSATRIAEVYPNEFSTAEDAEPFVRRPEALANRVYANKLGNRGEASGDGWRFRGRGLIQITGRDDYTEFGSTLGMTPEEAAAYCEQPVGAAMSGCWYLASRGCLVRADHWLISDITSSVNGAAMVGAEQRREYSDAMLKALGDWLTPADSFGTAKSRIVNSMT